eukprot:TRINITY_DN6571_c0_g1_i1.p1 TRINITY_DN6571_c0_g1~~TRINITY_DN6571_c0_g1_i1.p1  ORF type:complete len:230 (-),score=18.94 TRINITY_DN6571_c0_g1_i1:602-1291(-)
MKSCKFCRALKNCTDGYTSFVLNLGENLLDNYLGKYKAELFKQIKENKSPQVVLEVGIGTGPNLKYYANEKVTVIGIDPNLAMVRGAIKRVEEIGMINSFSTKVGFSEDLPLQDNSVDHAVVTLVLCSVRDVEKSLQEIKRVLKPGGTLHFIEHVISPPKTIRRFFQRIFTPFQQFFAGGCHLDRDLLANIVQTKLQIVDVLTLDTSPWSLEGPLLIGHAVNPSQNNNN